MAARTATNIRSGKLRVLVVEDEDSIRNGLCDVLAFHGYAPEAVASGEDGLRRSLDEDFDLVLLDIMLPGLNGLDVCRRLRAERPGVQILLLTAKGAEDDVIAGLRAGADDYVSKPFSVRELVARVEVLARRAKAGWPAEQFTFGPWTVDGQGLRAHDGTREISLSPREVDLLALFARENGRVITRQQLLVDVWHLHNADQIETRTVDVHIAKLRRKIDGDDASDSSTGEISLNETSLIETVRGAGYRARLDPGRRR